MTLDPDELQQFIITALGELRPAALLIILQLDLGFSRSRFRNYIMELLQMSCSGFLYHARKWTEDPHLQPLQIMDTYHLLWEGFPSSEPYSQSRNQKIKYFMDAYRNRRMEEMHAQFASS